MSAKYQVTAAGWTLEEALRRTANRCLLRKINLAALDEKPATEELKQLETAFWIYLREGRLEATSSIKGATSKVLGEEYLANCEVANWHQSIVKHHGKRTISVQGVRIHPILRSSNAARRLSGMGFVEAFSKFVLDDPEVAALNERQRNPTSLKNGMRPGPVPDFHWRLNITAEQLAFEYTSSIASNTDDNSPTPSAEQVEISLALSDRLNGLKDLLANGRVTAKGTLQTGEVVSIDAHQWNRDEIFIDALNGDLCWELQNKPVPIWSGLSFLSTGNMSPQNRKAQKPEKSKVTAHYSSVREAILAEWPDGIPESLTVGARDQKIMARQKLNKSTIVSAKTIERYLSKHGSLHRKKTKR